MAWWQREHERIDRRPAKTNWRPPRRLPPPASLLRDKLIELLEDEDYGAARASELAAHVAEADIARFLAGDNAALTRAFMNFIDDFGLDMSTNRTIRSSHARARIEAAAEARRKEFAYLWSLPWLAQSLWREAKARAAAAKLESASRAETSEAQRQRRLQFIDPKWR
jgi:hypothetical protein